MPKRAPQPQADTSSECTDGRGPRQESVRGCRDEPAAATCFERRRLGGLLDLPLSSLRSWGDCPGTCTGGGIKHSCIKNTRILKFIFPFSIFHVFFFFTWVHLFASSFPSSEMAHPSASLRTKPLRVHPKGTHHGSWSLGESTHVPGRVIADKFHERDKPPRVHGQLDSRERGEGHLFGGGIGARRARKGPSRHQRRRGTFRPLKKALREITGDEKFDYGSCFFSFILLVVKSKCLKTEEL